MILNDIVIVYIEGKSLSECLTRINELILKEDLSALNILKLSVFIHAHSNEEYKKYCENLSNEIHSFYNGKNIPVSYIAQKPHTSDISIEAYLLINHSLKIYRKNIENINYSVVESENGKLVFAAGLNKKQENIENRILAYSTGAFDLMEKILHNENLKFSNIIRQWNYIENILNISKNGHYQYQNYQIFNDVRSNYYDKDNFDNGYPSATGIGTDSGGIVIEFIALNSNSKINISPISNPQQCNAYSYTENVLFDNSIGNTGIKIKTTPKFERGKIISYNNEHHLFVSGTASIQKEKTVGINDIKKQTEVTLDNIKNVIEAFTKGNGYKKRFSYYRVYLKYVKDYPIAKTLCDKYFKDAPGQYLYSDICRNDLLIEIECGLNIS